MWQGLSEDAHRLLGRVALLARERPDGWVPDRVLWKEAGIDPNAYDEVAAELWNEGLVERQGSGYANLKATPDGMERYREI